MRQSRWAVAARWGARGRGREGRLFLPIRYTWQGYRPKFLRCIEKAYMETQWASHTRQEQSFFMCA